MFAFSKWSNCGTLAKTQTAIWMVFIPGQDGYLPPPFENEERGAKDQAEKEGGCDKVDKPEKAPRKMLSRGEKFFKNQREMTYFKFLS